MKNEIRKLYLKDKRLALEVAKVLGYKIKVKAEEIGPLDEHKLNIDDIKSYVINMLKQVVVDENKKFTPARLKQALDEDTKQNVSKTLCRNLIKNYILKNIEKV